MTLKKGENKKRVVMDIHMLKNFSATSLNRDDAGQCKTMMFGGITRGRLSSQCVKRPIRKSEDMRIMFADLDEKLSTHTRMVPLLVCDTLRNEGVAEEYLDVIADAIISITKKDSADDEAKEDTGKAKKKEKKKEKWNEKSSAQVIILSDADIRCMTDFAREKLADQPDVATFKKEFAGALQQKMKDTALIRDISYDIAMFGRMATNSYFRTVDGVVYVAHPFSVNRVVLESDFFTAVDDLVSGGSAMMSYSDFTSCCYYYNLATDLTGFVENMNHKINSVDVIDSVVPEFLRAVVKENPTGKQHSFLCQSYPSTLIVEIKSAGTSQTYADAFLSDVKPNKEGNLVAVAENRLCNHIVKQDKIWADERNIVKRICLVTESEGITEETGIPTVQVKSFPEFLAEVNKALHEYWN